MDSLLKLISENGKLSAREMADILGESQEDIEKKLQKLESDGILCGYRPIINRNEAEVLGVTALIELKVIPQKETGFDKIAHVISGFEEVESVYLMAGSYDLAVFVKGKSIQDISAFVSRKLSTLDEVTSTATHFLLKRYKDLGFDMSGRNTTKDHRSMLV